MSFVGSAKKPGCFFCAGAAGGPSRKSLVLAVTRHAIVMLNRYPYNNGHLLVAPRRHAAELDRLSPPARAALAEVLRRSIGVVRKALRPEGLNVGLNLGAVAGAGVIDHLHWHVVPRWGGDTNFMPIVAEAKVMPQHLEESWDALRPRFVALEAPKRAG
jgi:ATP adenylyltransferase